MGARAQRWLEYFIIRSGTAREKETVAETTLLLSLGRYGTWSNWDGTIRNEGAKNCVALAEEGIEYVLIPQQSFLRE